MGTGVMAGQIYNRQVFERGREIFIAGEVPYCAYLIQSGAVDILAGDRDSPVVIDTFGPGKVLGGMALLDERPRPTTAVAHSMATGVLITRTEFDKHLEGLDPFTRWMLRLLAQRLRRTLPTA